MYKGELKEKGTAYQNGHATGINRAFSEVKSYFGDTERAKQKYTGAEVVKLLEMLQTDYEKYCDTYGMGAEETEE